MLRLCLITCLLLLPVAALAASPKDRAVEAGSSAAANTEASAPSSSESAGTVEGLPDLPDVRVTVWRAHVLTPAAAAPVRQPRLSFTTQQGSGLGSGLGSGISPLASVPLAGTARRLGAQRFNTDDGSMLDDFAICYRVSGRSSIEIIPGDPAPVKLPVVSIANNTGVTVGLVVRLSK